MEGREREARLEGVRPVRLYIPTYQRVDRQETWQWLPEEVREKTFLVARPEEAIDLDLMGYPVLACPEKGIANTRQWILDQHDVEAHGPIAMLMDDDLRFDYRRTDDPSKFLKPERGGKSMSDMFAAVEEMMQFVPFGGVANRGGANRNHAAYMRNQRVFDSWAVDVEIFRKLGLKVNRLPFMEDFDLALQFLTAGYFSLVVNNWVKGDHGSNVQGGCSAYRDLPGQEEAALGLAEAWPDFVTVVSRPAWDGMGAAVRTDVRIAWKKAWEFGRAERDRVGLPQEPDLDWSTGELRLLDGDDLL